MNINFVFWKPKLIPTGLFLPQGSELPTAALLVPPSRALRRALRAADGGAPAAGDALRRHQRDDDHLGSTVRDAGATVKEKGVTSGGGSDGF